MPPKRAPIIDVIFEYMSVSPIGLRQLETLKISDNLIEMIEEGSFRDLVSLTFLELIGNKLKILPQNAFDEENLPR